VDGGIDGLKKNYNMYIVFLVIFVVTAIISYLWATGIDNMKKNHPDYKGEDFLNFKDDENDKNNIY
jgi:hypothetical protein